MPKRLLGLSFVLCVLLGAGVLFAAETQKPPLTLDVFFNSVSFPSVRISPNGQDVVIATERADWAANRFRSDLWLYKTSDGVLIPLTQSGKDSEPQWSPDGRWIAFLSERHEQQSIQPEKDEKKAGTQVYVISARGGEPFRVTAAREDVHSFAWSADSKKIFFATREPWTKEKEDSYQKDWKDAIQYRAAERGDRIFAIDFDAVVARSASSANEDSKNTEANEIASTPYRVQQLTSSADGRWLAFATESISQREESLSDDGIYVIDLGARNQKDAAVIPLLNHAQAFFSAIE